VNADDVDLLAELRVRYALARAGMQRYAAEAAWWFGAMLEADAHREPDRLVQLSGAAARYSKLANEAYRTMAGVLARIRCMEADQWKTMVVNTTRENA
jgi:hypothetical protein